MFAQKAASARKTVKPASLRTGRPDSPWEYRALIWNFARSDLRARFKGTTLGWLWSFVLPLASIAIYSLVFSVFIRVPPPPFGNGDAGNYPVWLITGLVAWQFCSQILTRGMPALLSNGRLLRKVYFPSYVPVIAVSLSVGFQSLIELGIVLIILTALGNVGATWLLLPVWAAMMWLFATAVSYIMAVANVHWRDLSQIFTVTLQLLFFISAVIFPMSVVPDQVGPIPVRLLVELNPLAQLVIMGRQLMYGLELPSVGQIAYVVGLIIVSVIVARWTYRRWGRDVGEFV